MNNHITACCYGKSTDKYDNHVFKCINKNDHVAKEPYFKVYAFMTANNENKLLCYKLTYIKWDLIQWTANCLTLIATAAVYIKTICIIETLHY